VGEVVGEAVLCGECVSDGLIVGGVGGVGVCGGVAEWLVSRPVGAGGRGWRELV